MTLTHLFYLKAADVLSEISDVGGVTPEKSTIKQSCCPVSQIACLSCCSVLRERDSAGSDVGGRLLSTPSRLLRHTGQVSCFESRKPLVNQQELCDTTLFIACYNLRNLLFLLPDL